MIQFTYSLQNRFTRQTINTSTWEILCMKAKGHHVHPLQGFCYEKARFENVLCHEASKPMVGALKEDYRASLWSDGRTAANPQQKC